MKKVWVLRQGGPEAEIVAIFSSEDKADAAHEEYVRRFGRRGYQFKEAFVDEFFVDPELPKMQKNERVWSVSLYNDGEVTVYMDRDVEESFVVRPIGIGILTKEDDRHKGLFVAFTRKTATRLAMEEYERRSGKPFVRKKIKPADPMHFGKPFCWEVLHPDLEEPDPLP